MIRSQTLKDFVLAGQIRGAQISRPTALVPTRDDSERGRSWARGRDEIASDVILLAIPLELTPLGGRDQNDSASSQDQESIIGPLILKAPRTHRMNKRLAGRFPWIVFGLASLTAAVHAHAGVVLYEHDQYGGRSQPVDGSSSDLRHSGFNDATSSVVVEGGPWELCTAVDFRGRCETLEPGRYPSLTAFGMNDQVSSARPVARSASDDAREKVVLYQHDNYGGRSQPINGEASNLARNSFNDTASSALINRGTWELCSDADYRGRCETLEPGRYPSLGRMGLNDQVSSIRQVGRGGSGGREKLVLYQDNDYAGRSLPISGTTSNLVRHGFNDTASSIVIRRGTWQLCSDSDFRGHCETLEPGHYPALRPMGLNDKVSSLRQVGRGSGGGHDRDYRDDDDDDDDY